MAGGLRGDRDAAGDELRRRLRSAGATISPGFPEYSRQLRRLLAIRSEQALDLFHQTVSMKSVGNLNEFVRSHMLEPVDASERVGAIVGHFEDLTKAHEAVRRAREQLAALEPLVATAERYDDAPGRRAAVERQRDAVRLYFGELRIRLLSAEVSANQAARAAHEREETDAEAAHVRLMTERDGLIAERAAAGGDRLGELVHLHGDQQGVVRRGDDRHRPAALVRPALPHPRPV